MRRVPELGQGVDMMALPCNQVDGHFGGANEPQGNSELIYLTRNNKVPRSVKLRNWKRLWVVPLLQFLAFWQDRNGGTRGINTFFELLSHLQLFHSLAANPDRRVDLI
jgi:hypothetical protein